MQLTMDLSEELHIIPPEIQLHQKNQLMKQPAMPVTQSVISFGDDQEDSGEYGPWIITKKTDPDLVRLADRHYSRVTVGASQFTRPGPNLVLRTQMGDAGWVSWYSRKRDDNFRDVIECTWFRNESSYLSSDLVKWAIYATVQKWGIPSEGFITFVKDEAVRSSNPGANYLQAGFEKIGYTKVRKLTILQLLPEHIEEAIAEVRLIHQLIEYRKLIQAAVNQGEFMEAVELYHMAKSTEAELRHSKSERARRKGHKWDVFDPNDEPLDFLGLICPDSWIPEEMMEFLEDSGEFY